MQLPKFDFIWNAIPSNPRRPSAEILERALWDAPDPSVVLVSPSIDPFHPTVPCKLLCDLYQVMEDYDEHEYVIITGNPDRLVSFLALRYDGANQTPPHLYHMINTGIYNKEDGTVRRSLVNEYDKQGAQP